MHSRAKLMYGVTFAEAPFPVVCEQDPARVPPSSEAFFTEGDLLAKTTGAVNRSRSQVR